MEPKKTRTLQQIFFQCRRLPSVCVYEKGDTGLVVTPLLTISEKLKPQQRSIASFTLPLTDPGMYISQRLVGNPGELHFVIHHPGINLGTAENPQWETSIPDNIILQVTEIYEERVTWKH